MSFISTKMKQQPLNSESHHWLDVAREKCLDVREFLFSLFSALRSPWSNNRDHSQANRLSQRLRGSSHKEPTTFHGHLHQPCLWCRHSSWMCLASRFPCKLGLLRLCQGWSLIFQQPLFRLLIPQLLQQMWTSNSFNKFLV